MELTGSNLIDGHWHAGSRHFSAVNPATGQALLPEFTEAGEGEVNDALVAAAKAMEETAELDPRWAAGLLDAVADQIMQLGDALLDRAGAETALPRGRLTSERGRTCSQLKMFAEVVRDGSWLDATIDTAEPNRQPMSKPDIRRMFIPRGPVVVFGASNFPFAFGVCGGDTASALAAGNAVVAKGHPSHPGTSELFATAVLAAMDSQKLPKGLFALLQGKANELGAKLVTHPLTAAVGFTGSKRGGQALFDLAAVRPVPIPVYAEMGSVNPLVILPGAIRERGEAIAKDLAGSILLGGGQFCTKPGVILAVGDCQAFVEALARNISAAPAVAMLNQSLRDAFVARLSEWEKISGVSVRVKARAEGFAGAVPGLLETHGDVVARETALHEEAFGPAALVAHCRDMSEAAQVLAALGGNLTGTIHAGIGDDAGPLVKAMAKQVGRVILNGYPTGVEVCGAMVHGGPFPATTDAGTTSVGTAAIRRFVRMTAYQNVPEALLPGALRNSNPLGISRMVNGRRLGG